MSPAILARCATLIGLRADLTAAFGAAVRVCLLPALILAHLAFAIAESFALVAEDMPETGLDALAEVPEPSTAESSV